MALPKHNTGLIPQLSSTIWVAGQIPYEVRLESGDWRPFDVLHERQKDPVEVMACVTFSELNNIEIQNKFAGVDVNFSDRFTAKVSDTQMNGNTFERVNDSMRHIGVVPESVYPNEPKAQTWSEYYQPIPQHILDQAVKLDISYGVIPRVSDWSGQLKKYLKQSPLWITWPASPYHAMTLMHVSGSTAYVKDHYSQSIRTVKVDDIAIAAVVKLNKPTNMTKRYIVKDGSKMGLLVSEGFGGNIVYAKDETALEQLKSALEFSGSEPIIELPQ